MSGRFRPLRALDDRLSRCAERPRFGTVVVLLSLLLAALLWKVGEPLRAAVPGGMESFLLTGRSDCVARFVERWRCNGALEWAWLYLGIDALFLCSYPLAIWIASRRSARALVERSPIMASLLNATGRWQLLAVPFDLAENLGAAGLLCGEPRLALAVKLCFAGKLLFVWVGVAPLVLGVAYRLLVPRR